MALARMIAAALAEAENSYLAGAAPGLFSIMVCPSTQTGGQLAPDFRLAPFCRGGHLQGRLISNWNPPVNLSTLQALCTSREEVEGTAGINVFSSYVWRLAAVVVIANLGLEWFTTWQVEDVFAKIMSGEHPNVSATRLKTPVKAVLNVRFNSHTLYSVMNTMHSCMQSLAASPASLTTVGAPAAAHLQQALELCDKIRLCRTAFRLTLQLVHLQRLCIPHC